MISVKDPEDAYERVINPAKIKTDELGKSDLRIHTYRWTMFADNDEDAWESLKSWRGLRAPNRLQEIDPQALREQADALPKEEIMSKFSRARSVEELIDIYAPLVDDFGSEIAAYSRAGRREGGAAGAAGAARRRKRPPPLPSY